MASGLFNFLLFKLGWRLDWARLLPFFGGIFAAHAVKSEALCRFARLRSVGLQSLATWSVAEHWGLVLGLTIPLIAMSYATYRWIEVPAQRATPVVTGWVRQLARLVRLSPRGVA